MKRLATKMFTIVYVRFHVDTKYVLAEVTFDDLCENAIPADTAGRLNKVRQGIHRRSSGQNFVSNRPYAG